MSIFANKNFLKKRISSKEQKLKIRAIVFDADDTLYKVKTKNAYKKKFEFLSKKIGVESNLIEMIWREIVKGVVRSKNPNKRRREYSLVKTLVNFGIEEKKAKKLAKDALKIFWGKVVEDLEFSPKIKNIIKKLSKKYKLIVASEEFRPNLEKKLNKVFGNWRRYFEFLITPDITGEMKPSKKYYKIILKRTKLKPEEILVVGNSLEKDLNPARKLGIKTILVESERDLLKVFKKIENDDFSEF